MPWSDAVLASLLIRLRYVHRSGEPKQRTVRSTIYRDIDNIMGWSVEQAMKALKIPKAEQLIYVGTLKKEYIIMAPLEKMCNCDTGADTEKTGWPVFGLSRFFGRKLPDHLFVRR